MAGPAQRAGRSPSPNWAPATARAPYLRPSNCSWS